MNKYTIAKRVNDTVNEIETITYHKHHYVRKTGLKKIIKDIVAEVLRDEIDQHGGTWSLSNKGQRERILNKIPEKSE